MATEQRVEYLTVSAVAHDAYLTQRHVRALIKEGRLRSVLVGGKRLIPRDDAERLIEVERFKVAQERWRRRQQGQ